MNYSKNRDYTYEIPDFLQKNDDIFKRTPPPKQPCLAELGNLMIFQPFLRINWAGTFSIDVIKGCHRNMEP